MIFTAPVLKTLAICAIHFLLIAPTMVNGQVEVDNAHRNWTISGSVYACREVVRDYAYSSASYAGWMPTVVLATQLSLGRQVHSLSADYGRGTGFHASGGSGQMQNDQWGLAYEWLYQFSGLNRWDRLSTMLGAAIDWSQMNREYAGFVNDGEVADKWGGMGLSMRLGLLLIRDGSLRMKIDGHLGLFGFYNMGGKQPEAGPARGVFDGQAFTWMPGSKAVNAKARISLVYTAGSKSLIEAGYNFQTDRFNRPPSWGFKRQGVILTYTYCL